jgi:alkanesulfonate monooxygenase SsuD/methylene tetrahydromethanopterin reductase-like flavin-dependent oxidoreductase (luciferase family)
VRALAERLAHNGLGATEALEVATASPLVGSATQVADALVAYRAAGAAEALIDWPAPFDDATLEALAGLRS